MNYLVQVPTITTVAMVTPHFPGVNVNSLLFALDESKSKRGIPEYGKYIKYS